MPAPGVPLTSGTGDSENPSGRMFFVHSNVLTAGGCAAAPAGTTPSAATTTASPTVRLNEALIPSSFSCPAPRRRYASGGLTAHGKDPLPCVGNSVLDPRTACQATGPRVLVERRGMQDVVTQGARPHTAVALGREGQSQTRHVKRSPLTIPLCVSVNRRVQLLCGRRATR